MKLHLVILQIQHGGNGLKTVESRRVTTNEVEGLQQLCCEGARVAARTISSLHSDHNRRTCASYSSNLTRVPRSGQLDSLAWQCSSSHGLYHPPYSPRFGSSRLFSISETRSWRWKATFSTIFRRSKEPVPSS